MINYIIINGTNSNTINGLGINELPPISKPPLRVQTDTIDGRDGDITTNLGYGSYDKTITIGLFGTGYDINEVISFFNGEGTVVFSNEPDKYYKYKIINQIDYEALLKFKSATITFHCQPFKYPLEETTLEIEYEYIEQEDVESATMNNTNGGTSLKIDLKGNTSQYSTTGKNLLNKDTITNNSYINDSGNIATNNNLCLSDYIDVQSGENYTLSGLVPIPNVSFNISYWNNTTYISRALSSNITFKTYTIPQDCNKVRLSIYNGDISQAQFEKGSSATSYEPYTNGASPNPDYPQPINVVSGDNTIKVEGKNLFDSEDWYNTYHNVSSSSMTKEVVNGIEYYKFRINDLNNVQYMKGKFKENTQYKLTFKGLIYPNMVAGTGFAFIYTDGTSNSIGINTTTESDFTYTTAQNKTIDYIKLLWGSQNQFALVRNLMLIEGTETIDYIPYQSQTYHITLPNGMELCKIGDYQDYFTKNSDGQWCKYNAIGKVVLDGSETWISRQMTNVYGYVHPISDMKRNTSNTTTTGDLCNYLTEATPNQNWSTTSGNSNFAIASASSDIIITKGDTTDKVADFKTWLSTHNTKVKYVLATPYLSLIEDNNLIEQLDNIQNAISYEGQTNISQVNNDKPFLLDLIAMKKGTDEVVINNIGNTYSKPTIALEGTGITDIYLNNTEILQVDLTDTNTITIDTNNMEAYNPTDNTLANRKVVGNYNSMTLPSGNTTMKITGSLEKATITDYSRWL